ncbi:hypothetical protein ILUMI_00535 [Ignelater luminosus]|uniref:Lipase n=1 Tax=Ignelater luminosus TaxID=2038154 RepID=A0A8K0DG27_IGNLU|nr:hypothetical protein ILUMI_00535 [Ignelater luminosus]
MLLKFIFVLSLVLSVIVAYRSSHVSRRHYQQEFHQSSNIQLDGDDVIEIIKRYGYPVEGYTVVTEDGYLLQLFRIGSGIHNSEWDSDQNDSQKDIKNHNSQSDSSLKRPAVLLIPGIESSALDFVIGGPDQSLAFILADNGFDVFLGNVRGSRFGRTHKTLDPDHDPAFWRFCWEDIAVKDLPAIIDTIYSTARPEHLMYVGHMQGSTLFYIMASEKAEYRDRVHVMITLGPIAFLGNTKNLMLKLASEKKDLAGWITRNFGQNEFKPSKEAMEDGGMQDCLRSKDEIMCKHSFFLLNGYNSNQLNMTTVERLMKNMLKYTGTATKELLHYGQLVKSGRFTNMQGEDYNLQRINTPIILIYTTHDMASTVEDVDMLLRHLPGVYRAVKITELTNNLDLLFGNNVGDIVYKRLIAVLRSEWSSLICKSKSNL